ncbi:MAG TPA: hypothetical protein VM869_12825 [Enhygromyxa sp.]|nr:hypothetical protein [Enhygromyxa sp.]
MPQRGPAVLTLALLMAVIGGACRKQATPVEAADQAPRVDDSEEVDATAVCTAGCERLERCVPELASDIDGDPSVVAERLARACEPACQGFADQDSALAVRDCLNLNSCTSFWGCVGTAPARPWLAAVAPVGERTCENLCSQASACAIAKVCESESGGRKPRSSKPGKGDAELSDGPEPGSTGDTVVDPECMRDEVLRSELDERCLLSCRALPEDSRARTELIGCIDHVSCDGLLACLDGWAETSYEDATGPTPGISASCDGFCTRAIVCGAADSQVELEPEDLDELKQTMTSTYVECAVQCEKDLEAGGESTRAAFDKCTAVDSCDQFASCADEV